MSDYSLGLDLGTTSVKACAFDADGKLLEECIATYELEHPEAGAAEQDPEAVEQAARSVLKGLIAAMDKLPRAIGISTAMHSAILLNGDKQAISPVLTWADTRSNRVIGDFSNTQRQELLRRTGTPVHPMSPLVKLRWISQDRTDWWKKTTYVSDLKSYLVDQWTEDGLLLDTNLASATGLYNLKEKEWDQEALELARVSTDKLPEIVQPTHQLNWKKDVAKEIGLTEVVPTVIGGSDGCLANLGSDLKKGDVALSIGTSGAVRTTHQKVEVDPAAGLFNYHIYEDNYALGGATNNGGKVLEWLHNLMGNCYDSIGAMIEAAAEVDCDGLCFAPHIYGERAPIYDAAATGSFTGIRGHHVPAQFARAALEGVTDNLVQILKNLEAITGPSKRIIASGGFTRSEFWVQLLAEKSGREVVVASTAQASAYGAALMGIRSLRVRD